MSNTPAASSAAGDAVVPEGVQDLGLSAAVVGTRTGSFGVSGSGDTSGFGGLRVPIEMPAPTEPPFWGWYADVHEEIEDALVGAGMNIRAVVQAVVIDRDEMTYYVPREHLLAFSTLLRDEPGLRFELCTSLSGVHYPDEEDRELHVVLHLLSITNNWRIRVEVAVPESDPHLPSVVSVWPTVDWHERETYDFFGIIADGHPALTRIAMPDDWQGHPQRKDYPLGGIPVEYKGATIPPPDQRRSYN